MYLKFFGLKEKPFNLTPDPKFLYLGESHRESYAQLLYSVKERVGFVVLIGEVGTGKTTICRSFLYQLPDSCNIAYIFNPNLDDLELLKSLNKELGIEHRYATKKALQDVLYNYLIEQRMADKRVLLLIDEAQNLSPSVLEQIRLLSNLETETQKLIQIILVGQPELDHILENDSLRQLRQRVSIWCHLHSLDLRETGEYICHRVNIAGGGQRGIFTGGAVKEIHKFSRGIPRLINLLCDRSLLAAFSLGEREVTAKLARKCINEVTGRSASATWITKITSVLAAVVSIAALWMLLSSGALSGVFSAEAKAVIPKAPVVTIPAKKIEAPKADPSFIHDPVATATLQMAAAEGPKNPENFHSTKAEMNTLVGQNEIFFDPKSGATAVNSLLIAWGNDKGVSKQEESETIVGLANGRNFECFVGHLEIAQLEALNYAGILEVEDGHGRKGYLPVVSVAGERYRTGLRTPASVGKDWVSKHWNGKVFIFWKDYAGGQKLLKKGDRGQSVKWLQSSMLKLGYIGSQSSVTGTYGEKTARAIIQFQADNRIPVDGQAGIVTRMSIFSLLPEYKIPRLS